MKEWYANPSITDADCLQFVPMTWIDGRDAQRTGRPIMTPQGMIPQNFEYDGSSQPNWTHSVLFIDRFHHTVRRGALWHDFLYRIGFDRRKADRLYRKTCREDGANAVQAWVMWFFLRTCAWYAYNRIQKEQGK